MTGGVCVFTNRKIFGGDNGFTWVGTYSVLNAQVKGRVRVHNFDPTIPSVLGIAGDYEMHFSGRLEGNVITGTAMLANQPRQSLGIRLQKSADI